MSARRPRTPVYWPRMKVRGRRNREKVAARIEYVNVFPHVRLVHQSPTSARFVILREPEPGAFMIRQTVTKDGYGRTVPNGRRSGV